MLRAGCTDSGGSSTARWRSFQQGSNARKEKIPDTIEFQPPSQKMHPNLLGFCEMEINVEVMMI